MKIGSVVKCINQCKYVDYLEVETPKINSIYVVRGIYHPFIPNDKYIGIYLEEIKNGLNALGVEPSFRIRDFVELLPPEECSLEELLEDTIEEVLDK